VYFLAHSKRTEQNCQKLSRMHRKAKRWSRTHGSRFDIKKYQLVHLTRARGRINTKQPLTLSNMVIQPSFSVRYLGVMMDQPLRWWPHIKYVEGKARTTLQALRSIAGSTWGSNLIALRLVYQSTVIPQIVYGCSVWYTPRCQPGHTTKMRMTLGKIQLEAARIIAGAFRATSAAALDVELFLLPIHLQLEKRTQHTTISILTSPPTTKMEDPPIHDRPSAARSRRDQGPKYRSPIKRLKDNLEAKLVAELINNLEVRDPFVVEPWRPLPTVTIQDNREAAEKHHNQIVTGQDQPIAIYTNGSGINRKVGAAAVAPAIDKHTSAYMGKETTSTVYAAKLVGILIALEIAIVANWPRAVIFTDNQAALITLSKPER
jgi:hypothetical protein